MRGRIASSDAQKEILKQHGIDPNIPNTLGKRIRAFRESKHMSRFALSEEMGIDEQTLGRIERGQIPMLLQDLLLASKALDVPIAVIMEGLPVVKKPNKTRSERINSWLRGLTEKDKKLVLGFLQALNSEIALIKARRK